MESRKVLSVRRRSGFTLIELFIVVAAVALLISFVLSEQVRQAGVKLPDEPLSGRVKHLEEVATLQEGRIADVRMRLEDLARASGSQGAPGQPTVSACSGQRDRQSVARTGTRSPTPAIRHAKMLHDLRLGSVS
jgi:prepilin-type N-terminal cleavage/methylation domain-containing protein